MNEPKIVPLIIYNKDNIIKDKKEESYEEYQIIQEDYCSSPKCGIKSKIVTKSVEKINFSPIETSTNPYFKYCVIPIKDENFKYDFSQSETNHTRNQEEKNQKKNYNNNSKKNSYVDINEFKEENTENEKDIELEEENENITKFIIEKKESDINVLFNDNENNNTDNKGESKQNNNKLKSKRASLYNGNPFKNNSDTNHPNASNKKEKEKKIFKEFFEEDHTKKKPKLKTSQRTMHNIFILNDETTINNKEKKNEQNNCISSKNSIAFQSIKLKKNKVKNSISPFVVNKDKEEPIKVISSYTTTNINRLKKKKKPKESKIIRTKTINNIQKKQISNSENKNKKKSANKNSKSSLDYDISEEKIKNKKNHSNKNLHVFSKSQKRPKRYKIKGVGERTSLVKNDVNHKKNHSDAKDNNSNIVFKRGVNHFLSYKIKIDDKYTKELFENQNPPTAGRRRCTMNEQFNFDVIKPNNLLIEVKKDKEKNNILYKKKSKTKNYYFEINNDKDKDKDKDKEKNKEKNKDKDKTKDNTKNKEKDIDNYFKKSKTKEKKDKKKIKKKEKSSQKLKGKIKDLINEKKVRNKYSAKNLKLLFNDLKQKNAEVKQKPTSTGRRGRSHTIIFKNSRTNNINLIRNTSTKKLSTSQVTMFSRGINNSNNISKVFLRKKTEYKQINFGKVNNLKLDTSQVDRPKLLRRMSTRIFFHDKVQKEKITAYTNKQTIYNINDYIRRCLEVIPDLYALEEMPRCKTKIHPILDQTKKTKKIALFDLDETIVHCIGEINMNNVENFSRQCDAKLKVILPGGKEVTIGINIRPHWKEALDIIKDKYHIIAYTASHESYADSVLNYLDPEKKYFEYRLYRSHCVLCFVDEMKFYVKDLDILTDFCDLKDAVLIDNSVLSFAYHLDNGIPISPYYDSKNDCDLLDISNFLLKYADVDDIRINLREFYKLSEYLEMVKNNISDDTSINSSSISVVKEDEEGERTAKNSNNNKKGVNYNFENSNQNSPIIEEENSNINNNKEEPYNNSSSKGKNTSQLNLQYKEIIKIFEKIQDNVKRSNSFTHKLNNNKLFDSRKIFDLMNSRKNSVVKNYVKKKKKFKSVRYFDINFKKEWNEKQKELNSK